MKPTTSVTSPLGKGDHPKLDTSEVCTQEQITQYQSMIGAIQWIVTISQFDINTAIMTMPGFRMAPRVGHLNRLKHIYGYLLKMKHAYILGSEQKRLLIQTFLTIPMIGHALFMGKSKSWYLKMHRNHLANM
jgi:hypothetical protein